MDSQLTINSTVDLIALAEERDRLFPDLISSINADGEFSELLHTARTLSKFLRLYDACNANNRILVLLLPKILQCIQKLYAENVDLTETTEDDFYIYMVQENIQLVINLLKCLKTILEYLVQSTNVFIEDTSSVCENVGFILLCTFGHCKNCQNIYQDACKSEILELFQIAQENHILYLKVYQTSVSANEHKHVLEIELLNRVSTSLWILNPILSHLNIKSMTDNLKGYTAIVQKFSTILKDSIDWKTALSCLGSEINSNINKLVNDENSIGHNVAVQNIKITGFLIRVALKLFETFEKQLEPVYEDVIRFLCTIYEYSLNYFSEKGHLSQLMDLIQASFFKCLDLFLFHLLENATFMQAFYVYNFDSMRSFNLLNEFLDKAFICDSKNAHVILKLTFEKLKTNGAVMFKYSSNIFDQLILNAVSLTINSDAQTEIELLLLTNILQPDFWPALFAIEVWCLLLRNTSLQICLQTLTTLITKFKQIDFGTFTYSPEQVYVKILVQRLFKNLPANLRNEFVKQFKPVGNHFVWYLIGYEYFPEQFLPLVEPSVEPVISRIILGTGGTLTDLLAVEFMETLGLLGTLRDEYSGKRLIKAVIRLWEFDVSIENPSNPTFLLYFDNLSKLTKNLVEHMNKNQILEIFKQLCVLSNINNDCKLMICDLLEAFSTKWFDNPENERLSKLFYPNLLANNNDALVKQKALEVLRQFAITENCQELLKNIAENSGEAQGEIRNYLQKNVCDSGICDEEYAKLVENAKFKHVCMVSNRKEFIEPVYDMPAKKKFKSNNEPDKPKKLVVEKENIEAANENCIDEILWRMKSDVKCLAKELKKEIMSKKNKSDVKLMISNLESFL